MCQCVWHGTVLLTPSLGKNYAIIDKDTEDSLIKTKFALHPQIAQHPDAKQSVMDEKHRATI